MVALERLVIGFGHERRPHVQEIDRRAMVTTLEGLAAAIVEPKGVCLTDVEPATLGKACAHRPLQRVIYQAGKLQGEAGLKLRNSATLPTSTKGRPPL